MMMVMISGKSFFSAKQGYLKRTYSYFLRKKSDNFSVVFSTCTKFLYKFNSIQQKQNYEKVWYLVWKRFLQVAFQVFKWF